MAGRATRTRVAAGATAGAAVVAVVGGTVLTGGAAQAVGEPVVAVLHDPSGRRVGQVYFSERAGVTQVRAEVRPDRYLGADQFHGFHVHANDDPSNGTGCIADPDRNASTWFTSADGHWAEPGQEHSEHIGDLPSLFVLADRTAALTFTTDRFRPRDVVGRAVMVHAFEDNYANVPVGDGPEDYTPNSPAAVDLTERTGNAGFRVACGVARRLDQS